ncbi:MAG TPA: FAD-binding oxidoreductase [Candidatus Limnocylindrales bacterium]|nr:FAD-binding oxidoreductase [Candidatus Limnocylindrales bacterium]
MSPHRIYDVIVVGGGSVGNPTAYQIAKAGLKVLVLDKRAAAGQGDNKTAIGGVRATHSDPGKISTCMESLNIYSTWQDITGFDIGWKPGGYCFPVYDENIETTLKGLLPYQKKHNLSIDWVGPEDITELIPGINTEGLRGGTYSPKDGQVSPILAAVAFQREAINNGATYQFHEKVIGYTRTGDTITGVKTDKGTYSAKWVVLASGAEAAEHSVLLNFDIPVIPDSHEAGISAPIKQFLAPLVVDLRSGPEGKTANFYFGQDKEGQVIFCYTPKELFTGTNRESSSEFLPILASRMIALIPAFKNLLIRRIWRGCYPMTPDGVPIIDYPPGIAGLILAVGMCGQGFMLGPGVGKNITSLILNGRPCISEEAHACFRYNRDFGKTKTETLK